VNYKTFLQQANSYHERIEREDTDLYFEVLKKRNAWDLKTWNLDFVRFIFQKYLFEWGGMARVYPKDIQKNMFAKFLKEIPVILQRFNEPFDSALISPMFDIKARKIMMLYDDLCGLHVLRKKKIVRIAPTATSKTLHFLFPNLFVIWDNEVVRKQQKYGTTADEYLRYLSEKRVLLQRVVKSFIDKNGGIETQAVKAIENMHAEELAKKGFEKFPEPITKLLDEINYAK